MESALWLLPVFSSIIIVGWALSPRRMFWNVVSVKLKEEMMTSIFKKMTSVTLSLCCLAFLSLTIFCTDAYSQQKAFPEKSIEIIAATPGSLGDLWIRSWGDEFSKLLKVPYVVVNKGGAMSQLVQLSMAKPDGHTIAYFSYPSMIAWDMAAKPPVDLFKDFSPLGAFGTYSALIAVEASSPFKTIEDLIDYAKKNPKKLKCRLRPANTCMTTSFSSCSWRKPRRIW